MRRYCYAIQIRTQQQEHFAFGEFTIEDQFTREQQRHRKDFEFRPVKGGQQQVKNCVAQFKSDRQPVSYRRKRRSFIARSSNQGKFSA